MSPSPSEIPAPLVHIVASISALINLLSTAFHKIPGSPIIIRYIRSSYQNDPWRSLLEVLLVAFALRTVLKGRTRGDGQSKSFIKFSDKEIDDLVDEWQPTPLVDDPTEFDEETLDSVPMIQGPNGLKVKIQPNGKTLTNLATPNWTGLIENEGMKQVAVETLREYGVGTCGPSGFYGTIDVHMKFESDVASFLGTEAAIVYSQSFSAISSVIPAFAKRGDIIVADRGVNFAIHKGLQISRSNVRWFAHGDMQDLERVLQGVDREMKRKKGKLTKRFIVAEGVFENDGMMLDLPKVVELKHKYKYRLILDESQSFGMIGDHGKGITEYYGIPATEADILIGSMSTGLATGGGFVAGSSVVCTHQRINSSASVFSASLPALLATTSSHAVSIFASQPQLFSTLRAHITLFRSILSKIEPSPLPGTQAQDKDAIISIPSHPSSALIHIFLLNPPETMSEEEKLLQRVVDECVENGILVTRARRLRGQEAFEPEPSLKVCLSSALGRRDVEKAGQVVKAALIKVCGTLAFSSQPENCGRVIYAL